MLFLEKLEVFEDLFWCLQPLLSFHLQTTFYFSYFTKAKAKVYNISSSSSSLSLSEVSISSPLISAKIDFESSTQSFSTEYETWANGSVLNFLATGVEKNLFQLSSPALISLIIQITISSIVIGLKNSYFPLIHLPSCYRTVCYRTVQQTNQIQSCSLNQPITFKVVV